MPPNGTGKFILSVARSCIYVALGFFLSSFFVLRPPNCPPPPSSSVGSPAPAPTAPFRSPPPARLPAGPAAIFLRQPSVLRAAAVAAAPVPAAAPPPPPPRLQKPFFAALVTRLVKQDVLGNIDAGFIAHYLPRYYVTRGPTDSSGSLWDIGANKGDTSQVLISALVPAFFCYRFYELSKTAGANCPRWFFPFYGVEMNPPTAAVLRKRAAFEHWDLLSYEVVAAGFSDAPGEARLDPGGSEEGSETASLAGAAAGGAAAAAGVAVPLHSVDSWRAARGEAAAPIFLLKIDTEGFDGKVIKGAEKALAGKHVKFLVAEYNSMWAGVLAAGGGPEWSLRSSTAFLWGLGYECHLLNDQHFVPLWGDWFDPAYEFWAHSNFICAPHCDADLLHLVAAARNASLPLLERPDCPRGAAG